MRKVWGAQGERGIGVGDALMRDARLSVPARGLAVHLLLLPDGAEPDLARLAARPGESMAGIVGYLGELERAGYLERHRAPGARIEEAVLYTQPRGDAPRVGAGRTFTWPTPG